VFPIANGIEGYGQEQIIANLFIANRL